MIYLDSSAIVKLVRSEPETRALIRFLRDHSDRVTSVLAEVEVARASRRSTSSPRAARRADRVLARLARVEMDAPIRARAATLEPFALRSLDAIHLATVLDLGSDIDAMVTYDERQSAAAQSLGISVVSPA